MSRRRKQAKELSERSEAGGSGQAAESSGQDEAPEIAVLVQRHMRFGWWSLLVFVLLGLFLETLHGLKIGWYLELSNTTRRHMWTLAHAHGTLLAVLNLVLAGALRLGLHGSPRRVRLTSSCLLSAALLLPAGFFVGGCFTHDGDPGIGIALVPVGGMLLVIGIFVAARG